MTSALLLGLILGSTFARRFYKLNNTASHLLNQGSKDLSERAGLGFHSSIHSLNGKRNNG